MSTKLQFTSEKPNSLNSSFQFIEVDNIVPEGSSSVFLDTIGQLTPGGQISSGYKKVLAKRARSKFYSDYIKRKLSKFLDSPLQRSYYGSLLCCASLEQHKQKIKAKYCDSRACSTCNRIRTAKMIRGYMPQLLAIGDLYFLTLTIPNVSQFELREAIEQMIKVWRLIVNKRLPKSKYKAIKPQGVRKLECTYNLVLNNYHPHFHIIIDSEEIAQFIMDCWLEYFPKADRQAQDLRKIGNSEKEKENALLELFKYSTKMASKSSKNNPKGQISLYHVDKILVAMRGLRVYQPFGGLKKVSEEVDDIETVEFSDIDNKTVIHEWDYCDWVDTLDGVLLTEYTPSQVLLQHMEKDIKLVVKPVQPVPI